VHRPERECHAANEKVATILYHGSSHHARTISKWIENHVNVNHIIVIAEESVCCIGNFHMIPDGSSFQVPMAKVSLVLLFMTWK
jgi:hypothetical protein